MTGETASAYAEKPRARHLMNNHMLRAAQDDGHPEVVKEYLYNLDITEEQYEFIDGQVYELAKRALHGRMGVNVRMVDGGIGLQKYTYNTLTSMNPAQLSMNFRKDLDNIKLSETSLDVPINQKTYYIDGRDLESSRSSKKIFDIEMTNLNNASYLVGDLEDEILIQGYSWNGTDYDVSGLYQSATNDYSSSADWDTPANIETSLIGAKKLLKADHMPGPYNLWVNPVNNTQLDYRQSGTDSSWRKFVMEILEGGTIIETEQITEDTAMLTVDKDFMLPMGGRAFELLTAVDITHEEWREPGDHGLWGRVYEIAFPVIRDARAICKLSDI